MAVLAFEPYSESGGNKYDVVTERATAGGNGEWTIRLKDISIGDSHFSTEIAAVLDTTTPFIEMDWSI